MKIIENKEEGKNFQNYDEDHVERIQKSKLEPQRTFGILFIII